MHLIRMRRFAGTTALFAAGALALAGCNDDSGTPKAAQSSPATVAPAGTGPQQPAEDSASPVAATPTPTPSPTPSPTLRDYTGHSIGAAVSAARASGLRYTVHLQGTDRRASSWGSGEKVCDQRTGTGGAGAVIFTVARDGHDCRGRLLHPPAPARTRSTDGGSTGSTGGGTGGSGGSTSGGGTSGGSSSGGGGSKACAITSPAGNCYADGQFCANRHHGLSTYGKGGEYLTCERDAAGRWRWSDGVAG